MKIKKTSIIQKVKRDKSTWLLIGSNIVFIFIAVKENWPLETIMFAYWTQSIIIGLFSFLKMVSLKKFSTEGVKVNNRPVLPSTAVKWHMSIFFLFHYGFFHFIYLIFILKFAKGGVDTHYIVSIAAVFFINHLFSFFYNRKNDSDKTPNIGKIMFFPYARILPMHITIMFGGIFFGRMPIILFLLLKTFADVIMHLQEHKGTV